MKQFIAGTPNSRPDNLETTTFNNQKFLENKKGITLTWFGHTTVLLNVEGTIILTDPVFSKNASPVPFSNKSFDYIVDDYLDHLPDLDIILISHDHYDHLDLKTIKSLNLKTKRFYVPLGVEAHLIRWGVDPNKIYVADWGDSFFDESEINLTATSARHFSGRGIINRNRTLWCSWVIQSGNHKIFFGGDSGYGKHFSEIGDKYGSFDLTLLECGQYHKNWAFIHSMPEQTIQAHIDLKGEKLLTTHWGKFKLSLHPWDEPIKRAKAEALKLNVDLLEPIIGEVVNL
jgi:L-ascorbate metabolism protein UlaG (beta-lactamase superfamily)